MAVRRKKTIKLSATRGKPKAAIALDEQSIEEKVYRESQRFDAHLANTINSHYERLEAIAAGTGEFAEASVTNRKSATIELINRAEEYIYEQDAAKAEEEVKEEVVKPQPLMAV